MEQVKRSMVDAVGSLVTSLTDYEKSIVDAMAMQKEITAKHDAYDTTLVRVGCLLVVVGRF